MADTATVEINFAEATPEEIAAHFEETQDEALAELFSKQLEARDALLGEETPSLAQVDEAEVLHAECKAIKSEQARREAEATAAGERWAAMKSESFDSESESQEDSEDEDEDEGDGGDDTEETGSEGADTAEAATETEEEEDKKSEQKASAKVTARSTRKVAAQATKRPAVPDTDKMQVSMTASAGVEGYTAGQKLDNLRELAEAAIAKVRGFPAPNADGEVNGADHVPDWSDKHRIAQFHLPAPDEFVIDKRTSEETQFEILEAAAKESRLSGDGPGQGLVAAGGWCSPSEVMYDLAADESLDGILSLPEVQVRRGGIRYTEGPQFADFYANAGFVQTEAQAIAGTTKPFFEVECPEWTDVRLDAVGLGITVPILTNAAYPELVSRFASGTLVAHEHFKNANIIGRIVALAGGSGALRVITGLGSSVSDAMEAFELLADERREAYRLEFNRTLEAVVPFWVRGAFRSDLSRRQGVAKEAITDADIDAHWAARKINVQYVYDWQPIGQTAEVYPSTYNALMYPSGTFVKGTSPIVNLSGIYDKASLSVNTFTALFVEQGLLVAKMQYGVDYMTLPVCNAGKVGAADLDCA